MTRELLPNRRYSESFDVNHDGLEYSVQFGFYPDGRVGEVFVSSRKIGSLAEISARDAAVLLSISLQHGVAPEKTLASLTHDEEGRPEGITGVLLERIIEINKACADG